MASNHSSIQVLHIMAALWIPAKPCTVNAIYSEHDLLCELAARVSDCHVQENLLQRGIAEKGLERTEAIDKILGAGGCNTSRYIDLGHQSMEYEMEFCAPAS